MSAKPLSPRLSVIVLTRNRLHSLRQCIRSILHQRYQNYEIVVLDDASDGTDTANAIAQEFADPRIRPYHATASLGVAGGRNFLMEKARGDIVVSIDDDAIFVSDNAIDEVRSSFESSPEVGIVAFRVTNIVSGLRSLNIPFSKSAMSRDPSSGTTRSYAAYFVGCGHAIRKSVISHLGGYRDDMMFGEEELDLAYRVIQSGYRIVYEPSIQVDHFPMPSVVGNSSERESSELYFHVRNRAYLAYRYLPWRYACTYVGFWLFRYAVRSLRNDYLTSFIRGTMATPKFLRGVKREVLDRNAIGYLEKYGGRLWY